MKLHYGSNYFNKTISIEISEEDANRLKGKEFYHEIVAESYESGEIRIHHDPWCPFFISRI